jgi:hypothetical protein
MGLPREVELTKDGGFYYRAQAFRHLATWTVMPFVLAVLLIAIVNPLWFRDSFFQFVERKVNDYSRWRNYKMYAIYLGCDPKMWHTLKDPVTDSGEYAEAQASP